MISYYLNECLVLDFHLEAGKFPGDKKHVFYGFIYIFSFIKQSSHRFVSGWASIASIFWVNNFAYSWDYINFKYCLYLYLFVFLDNSELFVIQFSHSITYKFLVKKIIIIFKWKIIRKNDLKFTRVEFPLVCIFHRPYLFTTAWLCSGSD